jgi:hypothetical protein
MIMSFIMRDNGAMTRSAIQVQFPSLPSIFTAQP